MTEQAKIDRVCAFWFGEPATTAAELMPKMKRWFMGGTEMDAAVNGEFGALIEPAIAGELDAWVDRPRGWLALILVLDQFTRNALRGSPHQYAGDARAQGLALEKLRSKEARALGVEPWNFTIMPLVHSEQLAHQEIGAAEMLELVEAAPPELRPVFSMGVEQTRKYREIISRFGRFPHRNQVLGRESTPAEVEFLRDWAEKARPKGMS